MSDSSFSNKSEQNNSDVANKLSKAIPEGKPLTVGEDVVDLWEEEEKDYKQKLKKEDDERIAAEKEKMLKENKELAAQQFKEYKETKNQLQESKTVPVKSTITEEAAEKREKIFKKISSTNNTNKSHLVDIKTRLLVTQTQIDQFRKDNADDLVKEEKLPENERVLTNALIAREKQVQDKATTAAVEKQLEQERITQTYFKLFSMQELLGNLSKSMQWLKKTSNPDDLCCAGSCLRDIYQVFSAINNDSMSAKKMANEITKILAPFYGSLPTKEFEKQTIEDRDAIIIQIINNYVAYLLKELLINEEKEMPKVKRIVNALRSIDNIPDVQRSLVTEVYEKELVTILKSLIKDKPSLQLLSRRRYVAEDDVENTPVDQKIKSLTPEEMLQQDMKFIEDFEQMQQQKSLDELVSEKDAAQVKPVKENQPLTYSYSSMSTTPTTITNIPELASPVFEAFYQSLITDGQDMVTRLHENDHDNRAFIAAVYAMHIGETLSEEALIWWSTTHFSGHYKSNFAKIEKELFDHPKAFLRRLFKQLNITADKQDEIRRQLGWNVNDATSHPNLQPMQYEEFARKIYTEYYTRPKIKI